MFVDLKNKQFNELIKKVCKFLFEKVENKRDEQKKVRIWTDRMTSETDYVPRIALDWKKRFEEKSGPVSKSTSDLWKKEWDRDDEQVSKKEDQVEEEQKVEVECKVKFKKDENEL